MIEQIGQGITFTAFFTSMETRQGATGLTVTVDVYKGGVKIVDNAAATEIAGGFYEYSVDGTNVDSKDQYRALFKTTNDYVEIKHVPAQWEVGLNWVEDLKRIKGPGAVQYSIKVVDDQGPTPIDHAAVWITNDNDPTHVIAGLFHTDANGMVNGTSGVWLDPGTTVYIWCDSGYANFSNPYVWEVGTGDLPHLIQGGIVTPGIGPNFSDLLSALRVRLNDADKGNYTDDELKYCLNLAYRETQQASKCHKVTRTVYLVDGTHTYYCDGIFEPIDVSVGSNLLSKVSLADVGASSESWNSSAEATPKKWMQLYGSWIRVYPTPSANMTMMVHGYGVAADMSLDTDCPTAVPIGFAASSILDRAEAEARKMRVTFAGNGELAGALMQSWNGWVSRILQAIRAK